MLESDSGREALLSSGTLAALLPLLGAVADGGMRDLKGALTGGGDRDSFTGASAALLISYRAAVHVHVSSIAPGNSTDRECIKLR